MKDAYQLAIQKSNQTPPISSGLSAPPCSAGRNFFDVIITCRIPTDIETKEQAEGMIDYIKENPAFAFGYRKTINPIFKQNAQDHTPKG